jgi:glycosyltransferase involved in cell wall biosynthesis
MKAVTLVCESFYPERTAGANRAKSIVDMLSKNGVQTNVVYLLPRGEKSISLTLGFSDNVKLHPQFREDYPKSNFIKRLFFETLQSVRLMKAAGSLQHDSIIISIPFMMLLPVSALWALFNRPVNKVLEVRDIIWKYLEFKTGLVNKSAYYVLSFLCEKSITAFDSVVTVTAMQKAEVQGCFSKNIEYVGNGIDQNTLGLLSSSPNIEQGIEGPLVITYAGSIGYPQNLMVLVKAMEKLESEGFSVVANIVGDGPEKNNLEQYCIDKRIGNVRFLGSLAFEKLVNVYQSSDILYGQLKNIPSLATAEPTKIFEYLATGKFIIFGAHGASEKLLGCFENNAAIEPDDAALLATTIRGIVIDEAAGDLNKRILNDSYIREKIISKYLDII